MTAAPDTFYADSRNTTAQPDPSVEKIEQKDKYAAEQQQTKTRIERETKNEAAGAKLYLGRVRRTCEEHGSRAARGQAHAEVDHKGLQALVPLVGELVFAQDLRLFLRHLGRRPS